jgi:Kdo2-lipid IVA lauroyltransferase/acyltransferase
MKWIATFFFYLFVAIISLMPFWVLYRFSDFMYYTLRYVLKYRKNVIINNLKKAFPQKTEAEINKLAKKFYKNLTDNMAEGLKTFTMRKSEIVRRHKLLNPEILEPYYMQNASLIGVTAHYNNWEWGSLSASLQIPFNVVAFYKPLSNKHLDKVMRKSRSRCGTTLASIYQTSVVFEQFRHQPTVFLMAADQSPSARELPKAHWCHFLGINTPFLHGLEKHAKNNNYAVFYIDIARVKRGFYELRLSLLTDKPNALEPMALTQLYAQKLETVIQAAPENWLWSHKRWKHVQ